MTWYVIQAMDGRFWACIKAWPCNTKPGRQINIGKHSTRPLLLRMSNRQRLCTSKMADQEKQCGDDEGLYRPFSGKFSKMPEYARWVMYETFLSPVLCPDGCKFHAIISGRQVERH